jgi:hypothetical protein
MDLLIDDLSIAAKEAIDQAAAEAAKAATLASLEREASLLQARAVAMREATYQQAEALRWQMEAELQIQAVKEAKRTGVKNAFLAGSVCLFTGLAFGVISTLSIRSR